MQILAPRDLQELEKRCQQIVGQPISYLAEKLKVNIPSDLLHAKGWIGQLLEAYLGADSSSKAQPDFSNLGIELKTIPVNQRGTPLESTYVCTVQTNNHALHWRDSWVYNKLKTVLWIPINSSADLPIADRVIQQPIFWHMDESTENILRTDWEELMDLLQLGHAKNLSAKFGTYLHIRPKAANNSTLINYTDADGLATKIVPKGFYFRTSFTKNILRGS